MMEKPAKKSGAFVWGSVSFFYYCAVVMLVLSLSATGAHKTYIINVDEMRGNYIGCTLFQHFMAKPSGFSSNSHSLTICQQNPFILLFLLFNKYSNLFPKVVNRLVEFLVNAIGDTTDQCKP